METCIQSIQSQLNRCLTSRSHRCWLAQVVHCHRLLIVTGCWLSQIADYHRLLIITCRWLLQAVDCQRLLIVTGCWLWPPGTQCGSMESENRIIISFTPHSEIKIFVLAKVYILELSWRCCPFLKLAKVASTMISFDGLHRSLAGSVRSVDRLFSDTFRVFLI